MKTLRKFERDGLRALREAVLEAAEHHRRMGVPMAIWRDGRVVEVMPRRRSKVARNRPQP